MQHLFYLNKYFIKYKWHLLLGIVFVALSNYFRILQPQIIRKALDWVIEQVKLNKLDEGYELQGEVFSSLSQTLLYFGALVLLMAFLMGVFMYFMRQTIIVMSRLIEYDMRKELFAHYENLHTAFYKRNNTGDLMSRITEDVSKVRMYLGPALLYGINLITLFIFVISSMLAVSVELTLWSLLPLPILSISIYYISNLINKKSEIIQVQLAKLNSISQEIYAGIRVVKSYVQINPMTKHFSEESEDFKEKSMALAKVNALFFPSMLLLIGISTIITVYVGGILVAQDKISPGNIAEFVIYVNMLTWPVTAIGWIASIIQQAAASQKRINEFLLTKPEIENTNQIAKKIDGWIEFDKVSFTYPDTGIEALKNVSFTIKKGERLAIIGRTGSGKTTIADMLVRMYDTSAGEIRLDGKNIQSLNLGDLRKQIGYVPQDVFLFSDTISSNIAFGKPNAEQTTIESYAKYAAVYDEIMGLSDGFDTLVGERGVTLSGGQKQRISIARALIKQPEIILLDDCLSAVDTNTEQQIAGHLNGVLADKTTIVITHRIYGMLEFDRIIVLDKGQVVEQGTHHELLDQKGYYYEQYQVQKMEDEQIKN